MGNALMDIQIEVEEEALASLPYPKEGMTLIAAEKRDSLFQTLGKKSSHYRSGGSAANTLAAIAGLGGRTALLGCVGSDSLGKRYVEDLDGIGVEFIPSSSSLPTGTCVVLVTPDSKRTLLTTLGCAPFLQESQVDTSLISRARLLYVEGYLWDDPQTIAAIRKAIIYAKKHGVRIAFSASDSFCVHRHKADFLRLIQEDVDMLFANAEEAKALVSRDSLPEAGDALGDLCQLVALTDGEKGSLLFHRQKRVNIPPVPCRAVDTTGAGDAYAAGFLMGFIRDHSLEEMGKLGSKIASEVVSRRGAR